MFIRKRKLNNIMDRLCALENAQRICVVQKVRVGDSEVSEHRMLTLYNAIQHLITFLNIEFEYEPNKEGFRRIKLEDK